MEFPISDLKKWRMSQFWMEMILNLCRSLVPLLTRFVFFTLTYKVHCTLKSFSGLFFFTLFCINVMPRTRIYGSSLMVSMSARRKPQLDQMSDQYNCKLYLHLVLRVSPRTRDNAERPTSLKRFIFFKKKEESPPIFFTV